MIQPGAGSPEPVSSCPLCGHQGRECWPEPMEYLKGVAASQQKREKGDRFAIVMLRMTDANGNRGDI